MNHGGAVNRIKSAKVGTVVLVMAVTLAASAIFQILSYRNSTHVEEISRRDAHVRDVLFSLAALRSAVQDAVIGHSGYLLSGQASELEVYRSAAARVPELLRQVHALTSDDPVEAASARALQPPIDAELANLEQNVRGIGTDAQLTGRIRSLLDQMTAHEQHLRTRYLAETQAEAATQSRLLVAAAVYRVFVLIAGCTLILGQQARQRRIERLCRQSEELFRNAFDHTATGMALSDQTGRWVKVNRALCQMVGFTAEELIQLGPGSVCHPEDRNTDGTLATESTAVSVGEAPREKRFIHRDGHTVLTLVTDSVVNSDDGRPQTFISHIQDITERRRAEDRLRHLSLHDALTGLPNRRLLVERIQRGIERARLDPSHKLAVLFLDLDQFKQINDSLGHAAGDKLLIAVAERLSRCVRAGDPVVAGGAGGDGHTVARLAGDEFTVLLEGLRASADAQTVAERILRELGKPVEFCGHPMRAAASIGIVHGDARQYSSARDLLADADAALYHAKASGRGRYAVFDANTPPRTLGSPNPPTDQPSQTSAAA